jgi:ParB family chromosome partitioning protein
MDKSNQQVSRMATKKNKGLGLGLDALLGPKVAETPAGDDSPRELKLTQMVAGQYQPRTRMDEGALYELAESIKSQGIMQPILVRKLSSGTHTGKYEIIAGERRFRAAKLAGLTQVPVLVREVSDENTAIMALIENMQREDLNALEEAQGLQRLISEFKLTHEQAAQAVGKSRSAASNLMRLLNLTRAVQDMLMAGDIDMGHARALLAVDHAQQITLAHEISGKKLSVRQAEALVKKAQQQDGSAAPGKAGKASKSGDIKRMEEELSDRLMAQVSISVKKGRGKSQSGSLSIDFGSLDALNGLIERLRGV